MFSGNWKESSESHITLNIPDPHITVEGILTYNLMGYCCHMFVVLPCQLFLDLYLMHFSLWYAALDTAFSSLYRDEVHLASEHILPTIAAATMLQMVSIVNSTLS